MQDRSRPRLYSDDGQLSLFPQEQIDENGTGSRPEPESSGRTGNTSERVCRLDVHGDMRRKLLPLCRLRPGEIWEDRARGHRVGVLDASRCSDVSTIAGPGEIDLIVNDPPYNVVVGNANTRNLPRTDIRSYLELSRHWLENAVRVLAVHSHLYLWIGADYRAGFQPLPEIMTLMREFPSLKARNFITMRNQRGYGTQKNWMWVRQELLHYTRGSPRFQVVYTEIPKILRGYYKTVGGSKTENLQRSRSRNIRPGNVWVDIQQVFYRMQENVPGCYAQKPLAAIERILLSSSEQGQTVADFFSHSGTTLIAGEKLGRRVCTFDNDPLFAEITIRRLERYRETGKTGWQWRSPFPELEDDT